MLTPRIAAFLLGFLALETSICALLITDSSRPLRHAEAGIFGTLFSLAHGEDDYVVDAGISQPRVQYARPVVPGSPLPYLRVEVDHERKPLDDEGNVNEDYLFEKYPLAPLDWGVVLDNARGAGYELLALAQPLTWQGGSSAELLALDSRIKDFPRSVLTVDLKRGPDLGGRPPAVPRYLARNAIPVSQVDGNPKRFEEVNEVVFPPSTTGGVNTIFAFRSLTSSDEQANRHAFALWGDVLIPSFPVAVAMLRHDATPAEVKVVMGRHIQVGKGPVIPIDDNGRLQLESAAIPNDASRTVIAETLLEVEEIPQVGDRDTPGILLFANATAGADRPWGRPEALQDLLNTIDTLPQPGPAVAHPRLPAWGEVLFFGALSLVVALFLRLRPLPRLGAFAGTALVATLILFVLLRTTSTWIPVLPLLITCLVGLGLSFAMRRHAFPREERAPSEKPSPEPQPASS